MITENWENSYASQTIVDKTVNKTGGKFRDIRWINFPRLYPLFPTQCCNYLLHILHLIQQHWIGGGGGGGIWGRIQEQNFTLNWWRQINIYQRVLSTIVGGHSTAWFSATTCSPKSCSKRSVTIILLWGGAPSWIHERHWNEPFLLGPQRPILRNTEALVRSTSPGSPLKKQGTNYAAVTN